MALLEERRKRLLAEGLFEPARKRALPFLPGTIGVVTSPTGAVIRDILHRLQERFPRRVLVWPVRVQGDSCAAEVAAAIEGFNRLTPGGAIPRPDVLIVARGGGSLEDLWGFNEEIVVRAAASSAIPLIAAIGHETDTTLIDFAADLRAPTPTAAAEKAAPVRLELVERALSAKLQLYGAERRLLEREARRLSSAARLLGSPDRALATPRQRRDLATERLRAAARGGLSARRLKLAGAAQLLARHSPQAELARIKERLNGLKARLRQALRGRLALAREENLSRRQRVETAAGRLARAVGGFMAQKRMRLQQLEQMRLTLGPGAALARGFVLVRDEKGALIRAAETVAAGQKLELEFSDGRVAARAEGPATAKSRRVRVKPAKEDQGSLF